MSDFLSIVVISYNMNRELPRTLYSLSPAYQRGIRAEDYEVIVVDNGSATPPLQDDFLDLGMNLRIFTTPDALPTPVHAINRGLNQSLGKYICVYIDGARLASPGLLRTAIDALSTSPRAVVGSRGRYLGPDYQRNSVHQGYDQAAEDALLDQVNWRENGYGLFDVSVFDESSGPNWWLSIAESNSLFMSRTLWHELGGYDTAFQLPGGGLVNLDTWMRACELNNVRPTVLLGEGTFHQLHGGVATNGSLGTVERFHAEYEAIRQRDFQPSKAALSYIGTFKHKVPDIELSPAKEHATPMDEAVVVVSFSQRAARWLPTPLRRIAKNTARVMKWTLRGQLKTQLAALREERADAELIKASGYFDGAWYLETYPDVKASGYDPAVHYVRYGVSQHRRSGLLFDDRWYLYRYGDVFDAGANPLVHFVKYGEQEGRRPRSNRDE